MTMTTEISSVMKVGVVTADVRDKTIKVQLNYHVRHERYGKYVRRRTVLHVHDERNEAKSGDQVEIALYRRMSKTKSWRLVRVLDRADGPPEAAGVIATEAPIEPVSAPGPADAAPVAEAAPAVETPTE